MTLPAGASNVISSKQLQIQGQQQQRTQRTGREKCITSF